MKRFAFRLQKLLDLRRAVVGGRRQELGEGLAHQAEAEERADELAAASREERAGLRRLTSAGWLDIDAVIRERRYAGQLDVELAVARKEVAVVEQEVDRRRATLLEARRKSRVLEKLRDRRRTRYQQAASRAEQQELDDVAGRHVRQAEL